MRNAIDKGLGYLLIVMMSLMTLDVLWGVITRYALGSQASWTEELARFLLIWIGLLGAAWASGRRMHLSIDLLKNKPERLINILVLLFALGPMVIGGGNLMRITAQLGQRSPALGLPMSLVYAAVPLAGLLIIYFRLAPEQKTAS